ncbi:MAG TPA: TonB-dependent receptor [Rhizomicrobium sp.]|jgi:iron complex outermembrane receptor protein|nr:TonB-dependent receptor [Rhizomicrobium sp.]
MGANGRQIPVAWSVWTAIAAAAIEISGYSAAADAQTAGAPPASSQVETVVVTATTPLPGSGIDADKLPYNIQTLGAADMTREGSANLITALNDELGSVNIGDNLDDPFQPNILFRGFEASPVLGTPEGLAVYQNGVRINEAFGDSLNWDLIAPAAISQVTVVGSNPVYGLNALGGAVVINMKNGFNYQGVEAELSGGSWNQRDASVQYGANSGPFGFYFAARGLQEDGWREFSPDKIEQLYGDLSYRDHGLTLDLNFTGANNKMDGESPTPVQELAVDRSLIFTSPQSNSNKLAFVTLNGSYVASSDLSIQGDFYYRDYSQNVVNGNTTDYTACTTAQYAGYLCQGDGATPLYNSSGSLLPDISKGGTVNIGENDFETIHTNGVGGSLQATETASLFGYGNQLTAGASIDSATTDFGSSAELGTINSSLVVLNSGLFVDTPENTPWTATPVSLGATNRYYGLFATDTFNITDALAVTASGRYNLAQIDLTDRLGNALSGQNTYRRFNPAVGLTEKLTSNLTFFGGYSEGSRDPTPGEIECSNPQAPCLLPSTLSSDPPNLKQVVSHTWEAGLRGGFSAPRPLPGQFSWNADYFHTEVDDDIYGVATSVSTGYFQNIGGTRRQGAELGLHYSDDRFSAFFNYSYVAATFESSLLLNSEQNPFADANGNIQVRPGDTLPGIPAHRIKAGADYRITPSWLVGADVVYESGQYFFGDESNQMGQLPGYAVVNLHSRYDVTDNIELFVGVTNAFNASYETFGILGDPTGIGAPGIPPNAETNGPGVDNRFESPAPPVGAFGGVRVSF